MKTWLYGFLCGALLFGALPLVAEEVLRIAPGGEAPLADRVLQLEKAVAQLQSQVYGAAPVKPAEGTPKPGYGVTCAIETPFDGAFSSNAPTLEAAREQTVQQCKARTKNSIYCARSGLKCSHP